MKFSKWKKSECEYSPESTKNRLKSTKLFIKTKNSESMKKCDSMTWTWVISSLSLSFDANKSYRQKLKFEWFDWMLN